MTVNEERGGAVPREKRECAGCGCEPRNLYFFKRSEKLCYACRYLARFLASGCLVDGPKKPATVGWFFVTLAQTRNICPLCHRDFTSAKKRTPVVDHWPGSGDVRGIVCFGCNVRLGRCTLSNLEKLPGYRDYLEKGELARRSLIPVYALPEKPSASLPSNYKPPSTRKNGKYLRSNFESAI